MNKLTCTVAFVWTLLAAPLCAKGVIVDVPPEPRLVVPSVELPEVGMTSAALAKAQADFDGPVYDQLGRARYLVEFNSDAADAIPKAAPSNDGLPAYVRSEVRQLVTVVGREFGFTPLLATSEVGIMLASYLDEAQVKALSRDSRVKRVILDRRVSFSASLWQNSGRYSWGAIAMGQQVALSNMTPVYVLDSGVSFHTDLPFVTRLGATAATGTIGCYQHATHVAGIIGAIGASAAGATGSKGTVAGVPIVSVGVGADNANPALCTGFETDGAPLVSKYVAGLDRIKNLITQSQRVSVINISSNRAEFKGRESNW